MDMAADRQQIWRGLKRHADDAMSQQACLTYLWPLMQEQHMWIGSEHMPYRLHKIRFTTPPRSPFLGVANDSAHAPDPQTVDYHNVPIQQMPRRQTATGPSVYFVVVPGHTYDPAESVEGAPDRLHVPVLTPLQDVLARVEVPEQQHSDLVHRWYLAYLRQESHFVGEGLPEEAQRPSI